MDHHCHRECALKPFDNNISWDFHPFHYRRIQAAALSMVMQTSHFIILSIYQPVASVGVNNASTGLKQNGIENEAVFPLFFRIFIFHSFI